jgi:hypothetical protein
MEFNPLQYLDMLKASVSADSFLKLMTKGSKIGTQPENNLDAVAPLDYGEDVLQRRDNTNKARRPHK